MRQWRLLPEEFNREPRPLGVGVLGGLGQVVLRDRVHHEVNHWLI